MNWTVATPKMLAIELSFIAGQSQSGLEISVRRRPHGVMSQAVVYEPNRAEA